MNSVVILILGFFVFAVLMLLWGARNRRADEERRGWRLRGLAAGSWAYEEKQKKSGAAAFEMEELTDYREPPHHLRIMSSARWREYPEWTHGRRDEILARIRSQLKEPNYVLKEA